MLLAILMIQANWIITNEKCKLIKNVNVKNSQADDYNGIEEWKNILEALSSVFYCVSHVFVFVWREGAYKKSAQIGLYMKKNQKRSHICPNSSC